MNDVNKMYYLQDLIDNIDTNAFATELQTINKEDYNIDKEVSFYASIIKYIIRKIQPYYFLKLKSVDDVNNVKQFKSIIFKEIIPLSFHWQNYLNIYQNYNTLNRVHTQTTINPLDNDNPLPNSLKDDNIIYNEFENILNAEKYLNDIDVIKKIKKEILELCVLIGNGDN